MSRVVTLPTRWRASHCMIWGGTKPMRPILIGWLSPAPSVTSRSRITYGFRSVVSFVGSAPSDVAILAVTIGNSAPAKDFIRKSSP